MRSTHAIPLQLLAMGCNAILGIGEHQVASKADSSSGGEAPNQSGMGGVVGATSYATLGGAEASSEPTGTDTGGDTQRSSAARTNSPTVRGGATYTASTMVASGTSHAGGTQHTSGMTTRSGASTPNGGTTSRTAGGAGSGSMAGTTPRPASVGGGGTATTCTPGRKECSGNAVRTCNPNGQWVTESPCSKQTCVSGVCQGECVSGLTQCSGNTPQKCSSTGIWQNQAACQGFTPVCIGTGICGCPSTAGMTMVGLPLGYCIDSTEVTRAQYHAWLSKSPPTSGQISDCAWNATFEPAGDWAQPVTNPNHPVTYVDWCDAYAYCKGFGKRLCGKIGGGPNDPSNHSNTAFSQWYAACTSNDDLKYNYPYEGVRDEQKCNGQDSGKGGLVDVGTMPMCKTTATGYAGIYDLSGNAWEWEDSCFGTEPTDSCRIRGGSFTSTDEEQDCGVIRNIDPTCTAGDVGFRCCAP